MFWNDLKSVLDSFNITIRFDIMDVLGRCSKEVEQNIKGLVMRQMQKAILSSSLHIARMLKLSA